MEILEVKFIFQLNLEILVKIISVRLLSRLVGVSYFPLQMDCTFESKVMCHDCLLLKPRIKWLHLLGNTIQSKHCINLRPDQAYDERCRKLI